MKTAIQQWGNSLAVRIPRAFAEQARVKKGTPVSVTVDKGRLVITPALSKGLSLKKLLTKVTPANLHPETDWGGPAGKEVW
jgi:antitoxin MazE